MQAVMSVPFNSDKDSATGRKRKEGQASYVVESRKRGTRRGSAAVDQARLVMLVMLNIAQLWILAATVEAALARHYHKLLPLVVASCVCWIIALSIILWWRPVSRRYTSTGYVREKRR
jgi:hypothetical protein